MEESPKKNMLDGQNLCAIILVLLVPLVNSEAERSSEHDKEPFPIVRLFPDILSCTAYSGR